MKITLDINHAEAYLLRCALANVGRLDLQCINLQLKIANAILDAKDEPTSPTFSVGQFVSVYRNDNYDFRGQIETVLKNGIYKVRNVSTDEFSHVFSKELRSTDY